MTSVGSLYSYITKQQYEHIIACNDQKENKHIIDKCLK